jgi:glutamate-1-semialdehyde 2,1-aminomutase
VTNEDLFAAAQKVIPGGVNSPVRAFRKVGGIPRFMQSGEGAFITDAEGKRYIDFVLSWGPLILGHCHHLVVEALKRQAGLGMSYGAPTRIETKIAELVCSAFPSIEKVRFVSSGTEAAMSAIRLARAATGRQLIVKFEGCYHGHSDGLLVKAGSGLLTLGVADSAGVPDAVASTTAVLPYNDTPALEEFMKMRGAEVAAVIVEPVAGNMGMVLPKKGFLESIRRLTSLCGALLIFDEVITGFRFCFGGYQKLAGITPDLTCLGKIVGGGLPAAAFGGSADIMDLLAPMGPVYQAGTLSGNPLAMAAGLATMEILQELDPYETLGSVMAAFTSGLEDQARKAGIPLTINRFGPMAGMFFLEGPVETFEGVMESDAQRYAKFFHAMLEEGVYLAPSAYESLFVSTCHNAEVIEQALTASEKAFAGL